MLDFPDVADARAELLRDGRPTSRGEVEDYAAGTLRLVDGRVIRIACSWNLHAGRDAVIEASFYGPSGGARMVNENGSFFDFSAELFKERDRFALAAPPDAWGGRAASEWVLKLDAGERFSGSTSGLLQTSQALDELYARGFA
jgi:predicted dehydrogenase